ncbi:MAG: SPASM domain-containing protein, partial [Actinobacteria bacterium]|nr:SPASM domain-containing protein [Actinomycetota bacterium]
YYGWALHNRDRLLPTRAQLEGAESIAHDYQARYQGRMKIYYVVPDYYETRPKACMNGWGAVFLTIAPDGTALPCHAARELPGIQFPRVREHDIAWTWNESPAFNRFRGFDWMKDPCRTCPERFKDFGGCRCQAYLLTGDAENADPVCDLSPHHDRVLAAIERAAQSSPAGSEAPLVFRNTRSSRAIRAARPE